MATVKRRGNAWQATFRGPDGRERTRTFPRKVDAENWAADERSKLMRGEWIDPRSGRVTVKAFADPWLARRQDLAVRTVELYRYLLDGHILPSLGGVPLAALTPSVVAAWHAKLATEHKTTAAKAYRLLSQIMRAAVADRMLGSNPCQVKGGGVENAAERPIASVAEVAALADAMPEHLRVAVLLASWCQLRRAELLGLRRRDVDLLHGTLSVAVTRTKTMAGEMIEKAPKSEAGRRTVAIPSNVVPALTAHLERYVGSDPDSAVIVGEKGGRLLPQVLSASWSKAREKVGRTDLRLHDLRHAGLTWAAATGATIAELMRRAGHGSPAAALRYQHATEDRDRALADALAGLAERADVVGIADITRTKAVSNEQSGSKNMA
jgi:integrase